MAGVAGLNSSSKINGCDAKAGSKEPAKAAGNPIDCRTFPEIPSGWTYFVQRSDGMIKIGFSARPDQRVRGIAREFGKLEHLAIVPSSVAGEYETHQKFDPIRADGEWFHPAPELLAFIGEVKVLGEAEPMLSAQLEPASPKISVLRKTMSDLTVLRNQHKANSPVGHHCSNIMRLIQMPSPPAHLLKRQMDGLQRAMRGVQ